MWHGLKFTVLAWVKLTPSGAVAVACPVTGPHARALVKMGVGMEGVVTMSSLEGGLRDPSALTATTCIKAMGLQHAKYHVQAAPAGPQLQKMDSTAQRSAAQRVAQAFHCKLACTT